MRRSIAHSLCLAACWMVSLCVQHQVRGQATGVASTVGDVCACNPFGTVADKYESCSAGQCHCRSSYSGLKCERCTVRGEYSLQEEDTNGTMGVLCRRCSCNLVGTDFCGREDRCRCKRGVGGIRCSRCGYQYFGFSHQGCRPCDCKQTFGERCTCNSVTGLCMCRPLAAAGPGGGYYDDGETGGLLPSGADFTKSTVIAVVAVGTALGLGVAVAAVVRWRRIRERRVTTAASAA